MVLTAIEFLGLAFFLGVVAGAVLEQLARPRKIKPEKTIDDIGPGDLGRDLLRTIVYVPTVAIAPENDSPSCSLCGAAMIPLMRAYKCTSCGQEINCN